MKTLQVRQTTVSGGIVATETKLYKSFDDYAVTLALAQDITRNGKRYAVTHLHTGASIHHFNLLKDACLFCELIQRNGPCKERSILKARKALRDAYDRTVEEFERLLAQ